MFLAKLLKTPEKFLHHIRQYVILFYVAFVLVAEAHSLPVGLSLELAYGYKVKGDDDPMVERSHQWVEHFSSATSFGDFLVNWFPVRESIFRFSGPISETRGPVVANIPQWAPGGSFKKTAAEWKKGSDDFTWDSFNFIKAALVRGSAWWIVSK